MVLSICCNSSGMVPGIAINTPEDTMIPPRNANITKAFVRFFMHVRGKVLVISDVFSKMSVHKAATREVSDLQ